MSANKLAEYSFEVPLDCDVAVLVAPKGQLRDLSGELIYLRNDLFVIELMVDFLNYAKESCSYFDDPSSSEQLIQLTEKLVRLVNGKETKPEDLETLVAFLAPSAALRDTWPVLARATRSSLPSNFQEFAERLGVGRQSGVGKMNAAPSPVAELSLKIFSSLLKMLRDPFLPQNWRYDYLGVSPEPPPPLSLERWDFWRSAIVDDLTLVFGPPGEGEAIRVRRLEFKRKRLGDSVSLAGLKLTPEITSTARIKLLRNDAKNQATDSKKQITESEWDFSEEHPELAEHLRISSGSEVTGSKGLFNLLKREVLKGVKRRVELAETLSIKR